MPYTRNLAYYLNSSLSVYQNVILSSDLYSVFVISEIAVLDIKKCVHVAIWKDFNQ